MKKINVLRFVTPTFIVLAGVIVLNSCHHHTGPITYDETSTRGNIRIGVDESFKLILDTEIFTFESIYGYAKINAAYRPELDILKSFMDDSIRLMITSRKLTANEDQFLKSKQIYARTTSIAYDALAFIVCNKNKDTLIRYNQIRDIFSGKINNWKQINPKSGTRTIKVVFDNEKSGNVRYFIEKFKLSNKLPPNCYAVNNNEEVVNYVEKNPDALGVIGVNWISDIRDSVSHSFLKRFQVVAVSSEFNSEGDDFYRPYQGYIANKSYPFIREVYAISRETFDGLGGGFIAFLAGEKGQRIILKSKLVPSTMPIRLIQLKNQ